MDSKLAFKSKVESLPSKSGIDEIRLRQQGDALLAEGHEWEETVADFGIYEGSEAFVINLRTSRSYPSGRVIEVGNGLHIPLNDKATLGMIRDLIDRAIMGLPSRKQLVEALTELVAEHDTASAKAAKEIGVGGLNETGGIAVARILIQKEAEINV
jgi:hypothetical protein